IASNRLAFRARTQRGGKREPSSVRRQRMGKKTAATKPLSSKKTSQATSPHPAGANSIRQALEAGQGVLRLAPTWVPRSFLMPGRRIKLHPDDVYAYGAHRGGIDERWFASTTPAANDNRTPDEGLSWVVVGGKKAFTLADAVGLEGAKLIGQPLWDKYRRWPVYSKFFDNL